MGVKKLFTFLNNNNLYQVYPYLNDLINELDMDKNKLIIGIDANLFCYKYSHSYDNMLIGFFNQILKFLSNKIIPLYIFDGGTLQEKEHTNLIRHQRKIYSKYKLDQIEHLIIENDNNNNNNNNNNDNDNNLFDMMILKKKLEKNSIKINHKDIILLLELLDLLNIPYIFSHGEGEYLAVLLNKYNIVDILLTDDTDPIPSGINKMIKFYNNNVYYLNISDIYSKLKINFNQLCDFCILLGSDYSTFFHGLKPIELLDLIIEYGDIETIILNNKINNVTEESLVIINKIRNIYKNAPDNEKQMFLNPSDINNYNYNLIIDHNNLNYYSNIILEYWDDMIEIFNKNDHEQILIYSNIFKLNIINFIKKNKFNIKNIVNFIKNNIDDITEVEISNIVISFEYLNKFGI